MLQHKGRRLRPGICSAPMGRGDADRLCLHRTELPQALQKLPLHIHIAMGKLQEYLPLGRYGNGTSGTVEELKTQLLFQLVQLLAQRRLRDKQMFGGQGDILTLFHFQTIVEHIGIHLQPPVFSMETPDVSGY